MRSAEELRAAGRKDLEGRWNEAALLTFVYFLVSGVLSACTGPVSGIIGFLLIPMAWGYAMTYLALHRHEDGDPFDISHLLDGYRDFARVFCTLLLEGVYIILWCCLFIIPGIIKGLSYGMTSFILRDHPELKNNGAIELSMKMMDGHKMDLFWLHLTFIGWGIACIFTLGIGCLWLQPYMEASIVNFYEEVKAEYEGATKPVAEPVAEPAEESVLKVVEETVVEETAPEASSNYDKETSNDNYQK